MEKPERRRIWRRRDVADESAPPTSGAPDFCDPVVAWRVWQCVDDDGMTRLGSVYHAVRWPVREALDAECQRMRWPWSSQHGSPLSRCTCGIYATTLAIVREHLAGDLCHAQMRPIVGRVSLWGDVVECERGWRASRAYPERLYVPAFRSSMVPLPQLVEQLGDYGVPVALLDSPTLDGAADEIAALAELVAP